MSNNSNGKILIVDDDPMVLEAMQESFVDEYAVDVATSGDEALAILRESPHYNAIILDIRMARMDGLKTADKIKDIAPEIPIIFHTGFPGSYAAEDIDATYRPFDYVGKNEPPSRLRRSVRNAVAYHRLRSSDRDLIDMAREKHGMVGKSRPMREVYQRIERIGPTTSKVMILGPTGSGKELVAHAIHRRSPRAEKPLMVFNCGHKDPTMVESELFGHQRGAFTGAVTDRTGYFEAAHDGTLFLDEIGDLDITTQAKILRAIEYGEVTPVGTCETRHVDVRVICATHHDLEQKVRDNEFRQDLYFRLKGVIIHVPALKDRREDIPDLLDYFIEHYCRESGQSLKVFEPAARAILIEYDWPGNVRQLSDTVHALIHLSAGQYIGREDVMEHLNFEGSGSDNGTQSLADQVWEFKRLRAIQALDNNDGKKVEAARELQMDVSNFRKLIERLDITTEQ